MIEDGLCYRLSMGSSTILAIQRDSNGKKQLIIKHISEDGTPITDHEQQTAAVLKGLVDTDGDEVFIDRIPESGPLPVQQVKAPSQPNTQQKQVAKAGK